MTDPAPGRPVPAHPVPGESAPLRALARRVQLRAQLRAARHRVIDSLPAALQIVVAALVSYAIARYGFGHATPLIAVTVTITSLGLAGDARPRRVVETAVGVTVGIAVSEVIVLLVGKGIWQLAIVLFATLLVSRAVSSNPAFAVAAAVQSTLVVVLPDPAGGPFTRSIDAVIAGVVAIAATALIPRDPRRAAARNARALFSVFDESIEGLVDALQNGNHPAAELALERLRRTQGLIDAWAASLETASAIARISPWLQRYRPELRAQERALKAADLSSRHLNTLARRVVVIVDDGLSRPQLAGVLAEMQRAIAMLGRELFEPESAGSTRGALTTFASRLDPAEIVPDGDLRETLLVVLVRPLVVDLLEAVGMSPEDSRALLPRV